MSHKFKENEKALLQYNIMGANIMEYIKELPDDREKVKKIEGQLRFEHGGQYYLVHSRNEQRETDRILKNVEDTKDYLLVIYGMGNLTLVRTLINDIDRGKYLSASILYAYKGFDRYIKNRKGTFYIRRR